MQYIKGFHGFRQNKQNQNFLPFNKHYYKMGKNSNKSMFECCLMSEGYSNESVQVIKESVNLYRFDDKIINAVYKSLKNENDQLEILTEDILGKIASGFDWYADKVEKGLGWLGDKTLKFGGIVIDSAKIFFQKIKDIIGWLFNSMKMFWQKTWEALSEHFKTAIAVFKNEDQIARYIGKITDIFQKKEFDDELDYLNKDIKKLVGDIKKGDPSNALNDQSANKIGQFAQDHKEDIESSDLKALSSVAGELKESYQNKKSTIKNIYYSLKGFILEGGNFNNLYQMILEDLDLQQGDIVTWVSQNGNKMTGKVKRIKDDGSVIVKSNDQIFTKNISNLNKADQGEKKPKDHSAHGEHKKGIFGWLAEAVGFILNFESKLTEWALKSGTNTILKVVSSWARKSWEKAHNYVYMGAIVGLCYHIYHGLHSDHAHGEHDKPGGGDHDEHDKQGDGEYGHTKIKPTDLSQKPTNTGLPVIKQDVPHKESFLFENKVGESSKLGSKIKEFLASDKFKTGVFAAIGGLITWAIKIYLPFLALPIECILISIGVFELIGAVCNIAKSKIGDTSVCMNIEKAHHFLAL